MELLYLVQVLTAVLILCFFIIVMLIVMLCSTYCCNKPVWEKLRDVDIELESQESPVPAEDEAALI